MSIPKSRTYTGKETVSSDHSANSKEQSQLLLCHQMDMEGTISSVEICQDPTLCWVSCTVGNRQRLEESLVLPDLDSSPDPEILALHLRAVMEASQLTLL